MTEEWHAGLLGCESDDREGRILDERRLANALRVHDFMAVRVVRWHARDGGADGEPAESSRSISGRS